MSRPAGTVSVWLRKRQTIIQHLAEYFSGKRSDRPESNVPCGTCNACCRSFDVPCTDKDDPGLDWVNEADAPGDKVLRRNADGSCVYLVDGLCSIRDRRPMTCRLFDCRLMAYTGVGGDDVAAAVASWDPASFVKTRTDRVLLTALRLAVETMKTQGADGPACADYAVCRYEQYLDIAKGIERQAAAHPGKHEQIFQAHVQAIKDETAK